MRRKKVDKIQTYYSTPSWHDVLEWFIKTIEKLQTPDLNIEN